MSSLHSIRIWSIDLCHNLCILSFCICMHTHIPSLHRHSSWTIWWICPFKGHVWGIEWGKTERRWLYSLHLSPHRYVVLSHVSGTLLPLCIACMHVQPTLSAAVWSPIHVYVWLWVWKVLVDASSEAFFFQWTATVKLWRSYVVRMEKSACVDKWTPACEYTGWIT